MALGSESATAWPAAADLEELTTTAAPAADSDLATAAPIPLAEPVTIATLPCRLIHFSRRGQLVHDAAGDPLDHHGPAPAGFSGQNSPARSAVTRLTAALKAVGSSWPLPSAVASAEVAASAWVGSWAEHRMRSMPAPAAVTAFWPVEPNALSAPASRASVMVTPVKLLRPRSSCPMIVGDRPAGSLASSAG